MKKNETHPLDEFFTNEELQIALDEEQKHPDTQKMLKDLKNPEIKKQVDYERAMQKLNRYDKKLKKILARNQIDITENIETEKQRKKDEREKKYSKIEPFRVATIATEIAEERKFIEQIKQLNKQAKKFIEEEKFANIKKMKPKGLSDNKKKVKHNKKLQLMFKKKPKNVSYKRPIKKLTTQETKQDISI